MKITFKTEYLKILKKYIKIEKIYNKKSTAYGFEKH